MLWRGDKNPRHKMGKFTRIYLHALLQGFSRILFRPTDPYHSLRMDNLEDRAHSKPYRPEAEACLDSLVGA